MALSASSGSISGSSSSAAPRSTIRPIAVPSSSVNPSGRRSTTRPPTRTSRPANAGEVVEVGVRRRGDSGRRSRRRRTRRRALPRRPPVVAPFGPGDRLAAVTRTSAGKRGVTANRWSDAVGAGRRAIPVTVAVRPSTSVVLGIPAPGWPTTTTWSLPTATSARQRSPSLLTLNTRPETVTRRHSCAAPGIPCRTSGAGTDPLPETANRSTRRRGRSVGDADPSLGVDPCPDRWRGRARRQQQFDGGRGILDDDPPPARIEEGRRGRDGGVDRDRTIGDLERTGDRDGRDRPGAGGRRAASRARRRETRPRRRPRPRLPRSRTQIR